MHTFVTVLASLGLLTMIVGNIWLLVVAFQENIGWGFLSLFPPVGLIFVACHWEKSKRPVLTWVAGFCIYLLAALFDFIDQK